MDAPAASSPSPTRRWVQRAFIGLVTLPCLALLAMSLVETLGFMDGERVLQLEGRVGSGTPCVLEVTRPGETHTLVIRTPKLKLKVRIEGPGGEIAYEASALRRQRSRCLSFVPSVAGEYSVFLEHGRALSIQLGEPLERLAEVEVYLDDGRFAQPLLTSLGL